MPFIQVRSYYAYIPGTAYDLVAVDSHLVATGPAGARLHRLKSHRTPCVHVSCLYR